MEGLNAEVLVKSEKISQKWKVWVIWAVIALLIIVIMVFHICWYKDYKEGQEYGLDYYSHLVDVDDVDDSYVVDKNDSYADQCKDASNYLNYFKFHFFYAESVARDVRELARKTARKEEEERKELFYEYMKGGGYVRFSSTRIDNWFKYTNFAEYLSGYYVEWGVGVGEESIFVLIYLLSLLWACCFIASIVFTILVKREAKKELIVNKDSVLCKVNPKKSKQLSFDDISNVEYGKKSLKIIGTGIKFKIRHIINAESIKSIILDKKKEFPYKIEDTRISAADELKNYKELLDNNIISKEEFDAKKKQILGL